MGHRRFHAPGRPVWDVVADYLRDQKEVKIEKVSTSKLKNVKGNRGVADYPKAIG